MQKRCPRKTDNTRARVGGSGTAVASTWQPRSTPPAAARNTTAGEGGEQRRTSTTRDARTPHFLRSHPKKSFKAGGSAKSARGDGEAPEGSSGWATVNGVTRLPYLLDTGATSSIIPEKVYEKLRAETTVDVEELTSPIRIIQVDGSEVTVDRVAHVDAVLETEAGPYRLEGVALRVLPGEGGELIIGKADMSRIGLVSPETALAEVVRARMASAAAQAPTPGPGADKHTESVAVAAEQAAAAHVVQQPTADEGGHLRVSEGGRR